MRRIMQIIKTMEIIYKKALLLELYKNDLITLSQYQRAIKEIRDNKQNKLAIKSL